MVAVTFITHVAITSNQDDSSNHYTANNNNFSYNFRGKSIAPFCDYYNGGGSGSILTSKLSCTLDRTSVSYCNLIEHASTQPAQYQVIIIAL